MAVMKDDELKKNADTTLDDSITMDAQAYFNMGLMYEDQGDADRTLENYKAAAELGHMKAQAKLGNMYEKGLLVAQDAGQALKYYKMAAEQGDSISQFNLGYMIYNGQGCEKNVAEAMIWIGKAADQGDEAAQEFMTVQKNMEHKTQAVNDYEKKKRALMRQVPVMEVIYALYSKTTHSPFLLFDTKRKLPTVFLFTDKKAAGNRAAELEKSGYLTSVMTIEKKDMLRFYTDLYILGVQNVHFNTKDGDIALLLLEICRRDIEKVPVKQRPLENPKAQSVMLFYAQDLRKQTKTPISDEIRKKMDRSLGITLAGCRFMVPCLEDNTVAAPDSKSKAIKFVFIQNKDKNQKILPIFTDVMEFTRFNRSKNFKSVTISAKDLMNAPMMAEADFMVVNPIGVNFPVGKPFLKAYVDALDAMAKKKAEQEAGKENA